MMPTLAELDAAYRDRTDSASVAPVEQALKALLPTEPVEAGWRLARAAHFAGMMSDDPAVRRAAFSRAVRAAEAVRKLAPERVEGQFWWATNALMLAAEAKPGPQTFVLAYRSRAALLRAGELDERFHQAGPLRVLGRFLARAPWFVGGNWRHGETLLREAVEFFPTNTVTRLYLAELLLEQDRPDEARAQLEALLAAEIHPDWRPEAERDRRLARQMLAKLRHDA